MRTRSTLLLLVVLAACTSSPIHRGAPRPSGSPATLASAAGSGKQPLAGVVIGDCNQPASAARSAITAEAQAATYGAVGPGADGVTRWDAALGVTSGIANDYLSDGSFQQLSFAAYTVDCWKAYLAKHPGTTLTYAVPMLSTGDTPRPTLAKGAAGAYDQPFRDLATTIVAAGQGDASLRLGQEFNCSCSPWAADVDPVSYVRYFRHLVTVLRSVPGAHFTIVWNVNNGYNDDVLKGGEFDARTVYPDDPTVDPSSFGAGHYVDAIGDDLYDNSYDGDRGYPLPAGANAAEITRRQRFATTSNLYGPEGGSVGHATWESAEGWRDFAARWHKPFVINEWGLLRNATQPASGLDHDPVLNPNGGGDDPTFVDLITAWFKTSYKGTTISSASYFDARGSTDNRIDAGFSPRAYSRLRADLGH
jgi:hypothetical protein